MHTCTQISPKRDRMHCLPRPLLSGIARSACSLANTCFTSPLRNEMPPPTKFFASPSNASREAAKKTPISGILTDLSDFTTEAPAGWGPLALRNCSTARSLLRLWTDSGSTGWKNSATQNAQRKRLAPDQNEPRPSENNSLLPVCTETGGNLRWSLHGDVMAPLHAHEC